MLKGSSTMQRYVCIHGHFYQPPRENPWIEELEQQDSAYPYHDWNERITAECYAPNTSSRILDRDDRIIEIVNNYAGISFNFGPTLLSWMEKHQPDVYESILEADKISREKYSGHGSALAQVYNHIIMPLANRRDKQTQVIWGIKDFEHRFNRSPEGMWLAETAVDCETLDIMSDNGIAFTILAPHQAHRIRKIGAAEWNSVSGQRIDPKRPYLCRLPSGRSITIFFYDGPISLDVSFRDLLSNGVRFANRLIDVFDDDTEPQLVSIATDGETYGHHHRYGEMALTYCLHHISSHKLAHITVFGEYLEKFPPDYEVEIYDNTSWSCAHGIERWKSDCGCSIGQQPSWNQKWRGPLRNALDRLRNRLISIYEDKMSPCVRDPWSARNEYIDIILSRTDDSIGRFAARHALRKLSTEEITALLKLLEMQRNAQLMYTSCGWFFDEISGIETVQIMAYAARAIQLALEVTGKNLEPEFTAALRSAQSNIRDLGDGKNIYSTFVKTAVTDVLRVGAHYAVSSMFEDYDEETELYCYSAVKKAYQCHEAGIHRLAAGSAEIRSHITRESVFVGFSVLHLGDHNIVCGVIPHPGTKPFEMICDELAQSFMKGDITEVIHAIEKHFDRGQYSLWHLFRDEQRKILRQIITSTLEESASSFRAAYKQYYPLMLVMSELSMPLPKTFSTSAEFAINMELQEHFQSEEPDPEAIQNLISEAKRWKIDIDTATLSYSATGRITGLMEAARQDPEDLAALEKVCVLLEITGELDLELNLWKVQNSYFEISKKLSADEFFPRGATKKFRQRWHAQFRKLGALLNIRYANSPLQ